MEQNPLNKYNKLKRFAAFVSDSMREKIAGTKTTLIQDEVSRVDCLHNGDIYTKKDMWDKLDNIADCASLIELRKYDSGEVIIHNANYCHNPVVCPVCSDRVSKRRRAIFTEPIKRAVRKFGIDKYTGNWKAEYPEGYTGVYLATATIKDGNNLKERIDTLLDSLKSMRKMGQKRKAGRSSGEWSKVAAGISNVEIKIGSGSGSWHVHAHFLLFTSSPIDIRTRESEYSIIKNNGESVPVSKFNHEWYLSTGGEGINFDVRPIQFRADVNGRECKTFEESVEAQAQEVIKYTTMLSPKKGTGILSAAQYVELIQRRGTRRLFNTIGLMRCDKRNPDSLMTITERELRKAEYVESLDKKCYEVFASLWQRGGTYSELSKMEGSLFSSSDDMNTNFVNIRRRAFLAQTAKYQGEYRKQRSAFLKTRYLHNDKNIFEDALDCIRDSFKNKVSALWEKFKDKDFLPEFLTDFTSGGMPEFKALHLKTA